MRRLLLAIFTLLLSFGNAVELKAQNVLVYTSRQGLSNSRIANIYEDSRNNIWITTQSGVNRFDGVKMNVYRHKPDDPSSISHDESTYVMEYDHDHVIVGTGFGANLYDYNTDKFERIPFIAVGGDTVSGRVVSVNRVLGDRVFICFAGFGMAELKKEDGKLVLRGTFDMNTDSQSPIQLLEDKSKRLWIANTSRHLYRQTGKGFKVYPEIENFRKMCLGETGCLYVATIDHGIYRYNEKSDRFEQVASAEELGGNVYGFKPWTEKRLFVCTDGAGLKIYDELSGNVSLSTIKTTDLNMATSNVKDAVSDSYNNVWVGIYWKGVMMKPVNQSVFEYIGPHSITKNNIGANSVFAMVAAPESDGLWVASDNDGLYLISDDGQNSRHWSREQNGGMPRGFTSVIETGNNEVLLGTWSEGLWRMRGGSFSKASSDINQIFEMCPAKEKGCYWIATMGSGFYYYDTATGESVSYRPDGSKGEEGTKIIGNPFVYTLTLVDRHLYLGTADGLVVCEVDNDGQITKASKKSMKGIAIRHLTVADGYVWAATNSGLVRISPKTDEMKTYTMADGLPINSIVSLICDGGHLWIGTDYGLSSMDMKSETFTNFFFADGIQDNEFSRGAVLAYDGKFYFGGIGGITYFDSRRMAAWQKTGHDLHLKLVDVYVGDRTIHKGQKSGQYMMLEGVLDDCGRIDLNHSDNHFTLELCVPELSGQNIQYQYSVNGEKWMEQRGGNNRLVFDNLDPGTYKIRLRALAMGTTSEEREFVAVVHLAWYASTGAKLLYLLLFAGLCWLIYSYIMRRVEAHRILRHHRQQEELNEARIQFFMNISHEIRTPMTLIMSPLNKLINTDSDADRQHNYQLIKQNSNRILRLVNQMMDVRKIEEGKFLLKYSKVELVAFLQNIFEVFETNAQSRNVKYEFVHNVDIYHVFVDPSNMDKVVMNLLSNAFKFTPDGGTIQLVLDAREDEFVLKVVDSGCGIKDEDKQRVFERFYSESGRNGYIGTGIGLNLTSMLVKLHNGTVVAEDNPAGQGTQFVITMPVGSADLLEGGMVPEEEAKPEAEEQEHEASEVLAIDKPSNTHRKNAILVEDDEAIRQYVHSELSKELVIRTCSNGQEAWDYIIAHPGKVDVVVSDVMMPVMDGLTLCQKIKSNFNTNHIPVVLMTALGSDSDRIAGLTNGTDAYVAKPFNIDVLRTVVVQQLKTRQMLQGKFHGDKQQEEKIDKVEMESPDENLMRRVMKVINENMSNSELSVEVIADKVGISRVHFYRKMKDLTGQAPRDFLKYVRLKEAGRLLKEKKYDITGVSIATGFKSLSAFSTNFKSLYGLSPTEWVKKMEEEG